MILYVVATPIGNLSDISSRALSILGSVHLIIAEDTRRIQKLLSYFGIKKPKLVSYDDHYEQDKALNIINLIKEKNLDAALVSDSGTPCISDPGYRLVLCAHENGIPVSPIPGPSSLTAIVSAAGLACNKFVFVGFLPDKKQQLLAEIMSWKFMRVPSVVFFETTRRLNNTLLLIKEHYPQAIVCIGRELTKMFEQIISIPIDESIKWLKNQKTLKGEVTVMIELRCQQNLDQSYDIEYIKNIIKEEIQKGTYIKDIFKILKHTGISHKDLYNLFLELKK